jgi:hypothetical protein
MTEPQLVERLERLERDNWRLWFVAVGALALLAAAVGFRAVYAAPAIPQKIVAHEFDVVNAAGATVATMSTYKGWPHFQLDGPQGNMSIDTGDGPGITLIGGTGGVLMLLAGGKVGTVVAGPQISFFDPHGAGIDIGAEGSGPDISLRDRQGYGMDLGATSTVIPTTGKTQQTSAASIVMFGNDAKHHVIWRAP